MTPNPIQGAPSGSPNPYWRLVKSNRNFRLLWAAQIVSLLGDWFNFIATAALIAQLSGSGLAIGALITVRMVAPFLVSPLAGVVADRFDRKWILICSDVSRALVVLGFLLVHQPDQVPLLYLLTALQLGLSGFFYPARTALLPSIVAPHEIGVANTLNAATWSVMLALGAGIGGLVSGLFGVYPAFVLDSLTFLVSVLFLLPIRPSLRGPDTASPGAPRPGGLALFVEGLNYLRHRRLVLATVLHKAAVSLFISAGFQIVQIEIARDLFPMGEAGGISLGLMFAATGLGTGVGPILARRITGDSTRLLSWAIVVGYALASLGLILTAPLGNFPAVVAAIFLRSLGGGIVWVFSTQLLLQVVPNRILGRVFGTEFGIFTLAGAFSAMITGWAVDTPLGLRGTTLWLGLLTLLPMVAWIWVQRRLRQTMN